MSPHFLRTDAQSKIPWWRRFKLHLGKQGDWWGISLSLPHAARVIEICDYQFPWDTPYEGYRRVEIDWPFPWDFMCVALCWGFSWNKDYYDGYHRSLKLGVIEISWSD